MTAADAELVALLQAEVRALGERVAVLEARLAPRAPDAAVETLVREMRRHVKGRVFNSRELLAFAFDPDVKAEPLRAAISALIPRTPNPRRLGRLLRRRVAGVVVDGAVLHAISADGSGVLWGFKPS